MQDDRIIGLLTGFKSIRDRAKDLTKQIDNSKHDEYMGIPMEMEKMLAVTGMLEIYNDYKFPFESLTKVNLHFISPPTRMGNIAGVIPTLTQLLIESDRAVGILETKLSNIPYNDKLKLDAFKEHILKNFRGIKNQNIEENLLRAIDSCERGDNLGAYLICGRVVNNILQKIPGRDINQKIEYLKTDLGIKDGDLIMKITKSGRDAGSHELDLYPDLPKTMSLISETIPIVENVWIKLEDKGLV